MQCNAGKKDLRVLKTAKMLNTAMFSLLEKNTFRKVTVRDICDEAQISRATFYARYADKYDFLKSWLINLMPEGLDKSNTDDANRKIHNDNFYKNKSVIKNLITDSDGETLDILAQFVLDCFMPDGKYDIKCTAPEQVVLSNFFAGGMIFYIFWQVKNKFPPGVAPMNKYMYELIEKFREWEPETL